MTTCPKCGGTGQRFVLGTSSPCDCVARPAPPPDPEQPWIPQAGEPFWVAEGVSLSGCPTYWTGRKHTDPREVFTLDIHDAKPFHTREECAHAIAERSVAGTQPREHMVCAPAAPVSPPPRDEAHCSDPECEIPFPHDRGASCVHADAAALRARAEALAADLAARNEDDEDQRGWAAMVKEERDTIRRDTDAFLRATLGGKMFSQLWGPALEAFGRGVDTLRADLARERAAREKAEAERDEAIRDTTWQDHADHWQKRAVAAEARLDACRALADGVVPGAYVGLDSLVLALRRALEEK